ncbi:hypothetical protein [Nocardiopsis trehalosi]|jgi:hypothetical protein|uniref:hypothetical protein n=1 Tax=Nocardiopsis trehalosi TaxID=109329 RepID=UPI000ABE840B|nr:hypothetical protein [Nocardiopsis trehalosi]
MRRLTTAVATLAATGALVLAAAAPAAALTTAECVAGGGHVLSGYCWGGIHSGQPVDD